jgi:Plasmid pRiA4b ORF-3-like protein
MTGKSALLPLHERVLHKQNISDESPGVVLLDFSSLLDFVKTHQIAVSGTHQLLPITILAELNSRLLRTNPQNLKRPQQRSYPYIHGLYLLLRASGLSMVENRGNRQLLLFDEVALSSWYGMNMTERYFTLLGAWLLRGRGEILGEKNDLFNEFQRCRDFVQSIPKAGLNVAGNKWLASMLHFQPGLYNVALLDLFGLISIEHGEPEPGIAWNIAHISPLPFGVALFRMLSEESASRRGQWMPWELPCDDGTTFRKFQSKIQTYFPLWRKTLKLQKTPARDGLHVFKVSLGKVWRRIAIPGEMTLEEMGAVILAAFNYEGDSFFLFRYKNRFGILEEVTHFYTEESPSMAEVTVGELPISPGSTLECRFDFGEFCHFEVRLEKLEPMNPEISGPEVMGGRGEAPPQYRDIGFDEWEWEEE